jgi:uncharacterized protein YjbI with pentapeptide repeats
MGQRQNTFLTFAIALIAPLTASAQVAGRNVNMVSGTTFPDGDPFLQRQNEPSLAVSTRNPLHLLAGANDYRAVDLAGLVGDDTGDAWLGVFKSFDGGNTWRSTLLPGCPQNIPQCSGSPLKGYQAAADSTVRAGTNGLFYYSGVAFNRGQGGTSAMFVARFIDNNNLEGGDPIQYLSAAVVAQGTAANFVDKPWLATDIPRPGALTCSITTASGTQTFPGGNVYVAYSSFLGLNNDPQDVRSTLFFSRSRDCGSTWSTPLAITDGTTLAQGASLAVEPLTGNVWITWRQFHTASSNDAILVARSTNAGVAFSTPTTVAVLDPFDQPSISAGFRTNSYPSIAIDGSTPARAYIAWSQRGFGPSTDTRIVLSATTDPATWPTPTPVDSFAGRGHQVMPSLSFAAGKLIVLYYDQRDTQTNGVLKCPTASCTTPADYSEVRQLAGDLAAGSIATVFNQFLADAGAPTFNPSTNPVALRQSIDVRVAQANPSPSPSFTSVRVSEYSFGNASGTTPGTKPIGQLRYNVPNVPLFVMGTRPFMGDYIDIAPSPAFIATQAGTRTVWTYNVSSLGTPVFHAAWTDNRDIVPPTDGDWTKYTPPKITSQSTFDPTQNSPVCQADRTGQRDQNIYTARITQGLVVGSPANSKALGTSFPRSFIIYLQNNNVLSKTFRLTLVGGTSLPGGQASFVASSPNGQIDVTLAPRSSATRTVFATSTSPRSRITVNVAEVTGPGGAVVIGGLSGSVVLNPDPSSPDLLTPPGSGTPIGSAEVFNPDLTNPDLTNPDLTNPDLTNPDLTNPDLTNPDLTNPDLTNPTKATPDLTNPVIANPDLTNPDLTNPDLTNNTLTDGTYKITNTGNTTAPYTVRLIKKTDLPQGYKLQLIVYKVYTTPSAKGCTLLETTHNQLVANIVNPNFSDVSQIGTVDLTNPDPSNVSLYLEPGQQARVTVRVLAPTNTAGADFVMTAVKPAIISQAPNVGFGVGVIPGNAIALIVTSSGLPDTIKNSSYSAQLNAIGGVGALTWSLNSGTLPPGLNISSTGAITGVATTPGVYKFIVKVADSAPTPHFDLQQFTIRVADVLAVGAPVISVPLKVNVVPSVQLGATGGLPSFSWSLLSGTLPPGTTLNSNGTLSGKPISQGTFTFTVQVKDSGTIQQTASGPISLSVGPEPFLLTIAPASGVQGRTVSIAISGQNTSFLQGQTKINPGPGITATTISVTSPTDLTATLTLMPNITLGLRAVTVSTFTEALSLPASFNVLARPILLTINPIAGARTQTLDVTVIGAGTSFTQGVTSVSFSGTGIVVNTVQVNSPTKLTANITIGAAAELTARSVIYVSGADSDTLSNVFTVGPVVGTIAGTVFQTDGITPALGASVSLLIGSPPMPFAITATNATGNYSFLNVPGGPFTLAATDVSGTKSGAASGAVVQAFATVTVNINLLLNLTISLDSTIVGQGRSINGSIQLSTPAPPGGLTVNLSSNLPQTASVAPASVVIPAGGTSAVLTVTGNAVGAAVIGANAPTGGYTSPSVNITVLSLSGALSIPRNQVLLPGQTLTFPVSIGAPAASPLVVTLSSTGGPGSVTFTPTGCVPATGQKSCTTVTIPAGATAPMVQPQIIGGAPGQLSITASAPNYAPDTESVTVGAASCVAFPAGLIHWWPAEGNANDIIGAANGTLQSPAAFAPGQVGQGFSFPGSGLASFPHQADMNLMAVTLEGWIMLNALPPAAADYVIATKGITASSENYGLYIRLTGANTLELLFEWYNGGSHQALSTNSGLTIGTFHHVAATADGTTITFYVDGQAVGQVSQTAPLLPNSSPFQIGSAEPAFGNRFNGVVDELSLYNRALTATEIQGIFSALNQGKCSSSTILGWYNGDPVNNFNIGLVNGLFASLGQANVYENFIVPAGGWTVSGVFSVNEMDVAITQAEWEIRSGMSSGNGGTLIASGTSKASQTSLGLSGRGFTMYKVEVDNLSIFLPPGQYWLSVAPAGIPAGNGSGSAYTTGLNAVGNPPGNDLNNFQNFPSQGIHFLANPGSGGSARDWSLGVLIRKGCAAGPADLVSWWTADSDVSDLLGVNRPIASNAIAFVPAIVSNGFQFGNGGFIDLAPSATLANQQFTWSAWARPDGAGPNNDFNVIVEQNVDSNSVSVSLGWRGTDGRLLFGVGDSSELIVSQHTFSPGVFYLVTGTYDGSTFKLFVNGNLEGQLVKSKTILYSPTNTWTIGAASANIRALGFPRTWNGVIDELQAFSRALTDAEIQTLYTSGSAFQCRPVNTSISFDSSTVSQGRSVNGTFQIAAPAPVGGVIVGFSTSNASVASVSPVTQAIAAGSTAAAFVVNGISPNSALISASVPSGGYTPASANITVTPPVPSINIPANLVVGPGQTSLFPINLSAPATTAATITLSASGGSGSITFTPSGCVPTAGQSACATVTIPAGATAPVTQPQITGGSIGNLTITAAAPGYLPGSASVTIGASLAFSPSSVTVVTSDSTTLTLTASSLAPVGGFNVTLTTDDPTTATVVPTVVIPAGQSSATVTVSGASFGQTLLRATGFGLGTATATINVSLPTHGEADMIVSILNTGNPAGGIPGVSLGRNEADVILSILNTAMPPGGPSGVLAGSNEADVIVSVLNTAMPPGGPSGVPAGSNEADVTVSILNTAMPPGGLNGLNEADGPVISVKNQASAGSIPTPDLGNDSMLLTRRTLRSKDKLIENVEERLRK